MSERTVELDEPVMDEGSLALQSAVDRAERAEAELAKLKNKVAHMPAVADDAKPGKLHVSGESTDSEAPGAALKQRAAQNVADEEEGPAAAPRHKAMHAVEESGELFPARANNATKASSETDEATDEDGLSSARGKASHSSASSADSSAAPEHKVSHISGDAEKEIPSSSEKGKSSHVSSDDAEAIAPRGTSSTAQADPTGKHLVEPGSMDARKQDAAQEPEGHVVGDPEARGIEALREDTMMRHLLDSLERGEDIGHYGRLTFAMIARHFLDDEEVLAEMTKDETCSEEDARQMLVQVEGRDYSPPRRERILEWQSEQEFPIIPDKHDPDCGNVYKSLRFPKQTYSHIGHYQEEKASS